MKCPACHSNLAGKKKPAFCPLCGHPFEENTRPGFELTWAQMEEKTLEKKKTPAQWTSAWNWYEKAIDQDPDTAIQAVRFLEKWKNIAPIHPDPDAILQNAVSKGSAPAALLAMDRNPSDNEQIVESLASSGKDDPAVELILDSARGDFKGARDAFRACLGRLHDGVLSLKSDREKEMLSGLAGNEEERRLQADQAAEQKDVRRLLDALCRPLADPAHAFDQLGGFSDRWLNVLEEEADVWPDLLREDLVHDLNLRGIHLFLQTVKNARPSLAVPVDELLALQYEKAYLRPFEEIEETDFAWI